MTTSSSRRKFIAPGLLLPLIAAGVQAETPGRVLVTYFSRSGNTRVIACQIRRTYDATLFEIEAAKPYPEDYLQTVAKAKQEHDANIRPPLKTRLTDLARYDTVFLGFPIWGETAPPMIRSFLAAHDFGGKTVIPFITHGGYGIGDSLKVVAAHAPGAKIVDTSLIMQADQERATMNKVNEWLRTFKTVSR